MLAFLAPTAHGQEPAGRRIYEEQLRVTVDKQLPTTREMGLDARGWLSASIFSFDDEPNLRRRRLRQFEFRPWAKLGIHRVHNFYVRGLIGWNDWNSGDNPTPGRGDEDTDAQLERAWYQYDFTQVLKNRGGQEPPAWFKVKVGREFTQIGTALVLSTPLDMVQLDLCMRDWQGMAFLGMTRRSTRNIDDSDAVANHQERCMWGVQLEYAGLTTHRPFLYVLGNEDNTDPSPRDPNQAFGYDSQYIGLGSRGSLLADLRYRTELVGQSGHTYSEGVVSGRDRICAMAADVMLEYFFPVRTRPKVMFEYLFGSGDEDRRLSATSTIGGNRAGTTDRAFNAFGFRDTGLAFAPRISNLHMYTLGASFFPLDHIRLFKRFEVGSKVFFYHKAVSAGPISDVGAASDTHWVGWESDVFCNWRLTSDLSWTVRYGAFYPGSAYAKRHCRQYLFSGVVFSF